MPLAVQTCTLATGVTLPFVEHGDADGVPVVLLHGVTDSWRSFEGVLPLLPRSLRAMAVTQRGHGDASRPAGGYRTRDYAADVAAFLDARGIARAVVVGHSMGGTNALRFAIDHPDRLLGLGIMASFGGYADKPELVAFHEEGVAPLTDPVDPAFVRTFQESTLAHPVAPAFLDMVVAESLKLPARVWHATFAGFFEDDFRSEMSRVRAPTLLLWGDRDTFAGRADQDELLAAIPTARLVVYEGHGHALHWETPERVAADLATFVASLPRR